MAEPAAAESERLEPGRVRQLRRALGGGLVLSAIAIAALWWTAQTRGFPVGESRAVVLEVNECGVMEVEIDGETWSSGGTAGFELANAFALGPEPGVVRRESNDEVLFVSDLTDHRLTLRQPEFVNLGCVPTPEEPGAFGPVAGNRQPTP